LPLARRKNVSHIFNHNRRAGVSRLARCRPSPAVFEDSSRVPSPPFTKRPGAGKPSSPGNHPIPPPSPTPSRPD